MGLAPASGVEEISCTQAWARLATAPTAVLVDVRTQAEWTFVGVPDLDSIGGRPVFVEWQSFPDGVANPRFADIVSGLLEQDGHGLETELLFVCRSGSRSRHAAHAIRDRGYIRCSNLTDGFEGPRDAQGHRGQQMGWKAEGLPWLQS